MTEEEIKELQQDEEETGMQENDMDDEQEADAEEMKIVFSIKILYNKKNKWYLKYIKFI